MSKPLVSIVTPCYNSAKTLIDTAYSIFAQTLADWEWLLVDDASTDDTQNILRQLVEKDSRIRIFINKQNLGPALARQKALDKVQGRYIAFIDADDLWLPVKLEQQIAFMQSHKVVVSYTAYRRITEDSARSGKLITIPERLTYQDLLKNTAMATSTIMIDRLKVSPITMIDMPYEDYATWLSVLRRGFIACGLQQDLMRYRVRKGSSSSRKILAIGRVWTIYRQNEQLSLLSSISCVLHYVIRALYKRSRF